MKIKIEVTAEDIKKGYKQSAFSCPIAHAAKRALQAEFVRVCPNVMFRTDKMSCDLYLPLEAIEFIRNFDNDGAVEPFSFEVEVPESEVGPWDKGHKKA